MQSVKCFTSSLFLWLFHIFSKPGLLRSGKRPLAEEHDKNNSKLYVLITQSLSFSEPLKFVLFNVFVFFWFSFRLLLWLEKLQNPCAQCNGLTPFSPSPLQLLDSPNHLHCSPKARQTLFSLIFSSRRRNLQLCACVVSSLQNVGGATAVRGYTRNFHGNSERIFIAQLPIRGMQQAAS